MKATGMIRKIDRLGRIVLPIEMRKTLDLGEKDDLEIFVDGEKIILSKHSPTCVFCDSAKEIGIFRGKNICMNCLRELQQIPIDR
ncbi:MAG: AbrB/MazE/SpoVT family DNA-binding domain-containing protein [Oscillospiraceae bacterium]|nr:AbrB/MazE/SpoVT family DNA-binding domain-containing protein [Oscillospiraceae bacterium]